MMCQKLFISSNSAKFSAGWATRPAYNFLATIACTFITYRLGAVASVKLLGIENMPWIAVKCQLGNAQQAAVVAILPDNCHLSSVNVCNYAKFLISFYNNGT